MIPRRGFLSWLGLAPAAVAIVGAPAAAAASPVFGRFRPLRAASFGEAIAPIGAGRPISTSVTFNAEASFDHDGVMQNFAKALQRVPVPTRGALVPTDDGLSAPSDVFDKVVVSETEDGGRLLTVIVRDAVVFRQLLDQAQAAHLAALLTASTPLPVAS